MAAHTAWKGYLNFGLLSIPVKLFTAARDKRTETHNFHVACHTQIKMPKYCPACQVQLQPTEIVKGYLTGKGLVQITTEELDSITPETGRIMEISECVSLAEVDLLYFAESFFIVPELAGGKAFWLLAKTLKDTGRVAIVQITKNGREHTAILRAKGAGLTLHYMWFSDEIARIPEFEDLQEVSVSATEAKMARQLCDSLTGAFAPEQFEDGYRMRLDQLIASKLDKAVAPPAPVTEKKMAATVDIASMLEASLANRPARKAAGKEPKKSKGKKAA